MAHKNTTFNAGDAASRRAAMLRVIDELAADGPWEWVTFESGESSRAIEMAVEEGRFVLNIPHQEREGLVPRLLTLGITIPDCWALKQDKKKGLLSSGFLEIEADSCEKESLVAFIDRVGLELLGWRDSQPLSACLQN